MDYNSIAIEGAKILSGGVLGTIFTIWYQGLKTKKEDRKFLFLRMIASKGHIRIPQSLVDDLNTIDIVFKGRKKVLAKYHAYYEELCKPDDQLDLNRQQALFWDLLRQIGNEVGYKNLDNKTLNSGYIPRGIYQDHLTSKDVQERLVKYLNSGHELHELLISGSGSLPPQSIQP